MTSTCSGTRHLTRLCLRFVIYQHHGSALWRESRSTESRAGTHFRRRRPNAGDGNGTALLRV